MVYEKTEYKNITIENPRLSEICNKIMIKSGNIYSNQAYIGMIGNSGSTGKIRMGCSKKI